MPSEISQFVRQTLKNGLQEKIVVDCTAGFGGHISKIISESSSQEKIDRTHWNSWFVFRISSLIWQSKSFTRIPKNQKSSEFPDRNAFQPCHSMGHLPSNQITNNVKFDLMNFQSVKRYCIALLSVILVSGWVQMRASQAAWPAR